MNKERIQDVYKTTPMQAGMLFHSLLQEGSDAYLEQNIFTITGLLDMNLIENSFEKLIQRYDIFRTVFQYKNLKQPVQVVLRERRFRMAYEDVSHLSAEEVEAYLRRAKKKDRERGFDLTKDLLVRVKLFKTGRNSYTLLWSFHHILMDGWCMGVVFKDLLAIYGSLETGTPLKLPPVKPYRLYLDWLGRQNKERGLKYWREYLEDYDTRAIVPKSVTPVENPVFDMGKYTFPFNETTTGRLEELAKNNYITMNQLFQLLWGILLQRYNNVDDVVFGVVVSGRPPEIRGIEKMVGLFVNTVPVRIRGGETTFTQMLANLRQESVQSKRYEYLPLGEVQANTQLKHELLDHLFVFENYPLQEQVSEINSENETVLKFAVKDWQLMGHTNYDLTAAINHHGRIILRFTFNKEVYETWFIAGIGRHLVEIVRQVLDNPHKKVREIAITAEEERRRILEELNSNQTGGPGEDTVAQRFESQVEKTPLNTAVQFEPHRLTYQELNEAANRLAKELTGRGGGPGSIVAVMLPPTLEMITAILAVLKIGAAYLPIDPEFPPARISYILEDSETTLLLTRGDLKSSAAFKGNVLDAADESLYRGGAANPQNRRTSDSNVYMIYTSGTTGRPKGVLVTDSNLVNYVHWFTGATGLTETDKTVLTSSFAFDLGYTSIYTSILNGGELHLLSKEAYRLPETMLTYIREKGITYLKLTPSLFSVIINDPLFSLEMCRTLRLVVLGGEAIDAADVEKAHAICPQIRVMDEYGPTEATIGCIALFIDFDNYETYKRRPSIGKPINGTRAYIVDKELRLQPTGVPGELVISGACLAREYYRREQLTREKFIVNPYEKGNREKGFDRMYRTGDRACWLPGGNIRFSGRIDHQVKIRGFRIELGEIESSLRRYKLDPLNPPPPGAKIDMGAAGLKHAHRCSRCLLPVNYPGTQFDEDDVCGICREYDRYKGEVEKYFKTGGDFVRLLEEAKKTKQGEYDCLLLFSGGKDSSYVLYRLMDMGLKVLTFTFDNGYISDAAFANIKRITSELGVENIVCRPGNMNRVFVESLRTHHDVCHGCWNALNTTGTKIAREKGINMVISGLSRGQIFEMRLEGLFRQGIFDETEIEANLLLFRKTFHSGSNKFARSLGVELDEQVVEQIRFVDFFRYFDISTSGVRNYLSGKGWVKPEDTGFCSSNCIINDVGIYVHLVKKGYHFYAPQLSWDCRLGSITREEGLEEITSFEADREEAEKILEEVGYYSPIIKDVVVIDKNDRGGDRYLVAYFVSDDEVSGKELQEYLAEELPDYMIPSYFVQLGRLPLTPNGKIDRKALPAAEIKTGSSYIPPANELEKKLVEIWSSQLSLDKDKIGINDDFFRLGGHSLTAVTLTSAIHKELDVRLILAQIFKTPTVRGLARYIESASEEKHADILPVEEKEYYPVSSAQKRLYILQQMAPDNTVYNTLQTVIPGEDIRPREMENAFKKLIERHESLRTSFAMVEEEPVQFIRKDAAFEIRHLVSGGDTSRDINDFVRPFDLSRAPLMRVGLIETSGKISLLVIDMHHIISDDLSRRILTRDFSEIYEGNSLPELKVQYKEYSEWQNRAKQDETIKNQETYWLKKFQGEIPVIDLPIDYSRPETRRFEGGVVNHEITGEKVRIIKAVARDENVTPYMVLMTVFYVLLYKITGQEDIVVGTPVAGRRHSDLENIMGMFVNTLPLRQEPRGEKTLGQFLGEVKNDLLVAFENQEYQFENLVENVAVARDTGRNPLFDVMFQLLAFDSPLDGKGKGRIAEHRESRLKEESSSYEVRNAKFDLLWTVLEDGESMFLTVNYCTVLFRRETIERFIRYFEKILQEMADSGRRTAEIEIISDEEKQRLLREFNNTTAEYPRDRTIYELFAEQVDKTPDHTAVVGALESQGESNLQIHLTYRELSERSNPPAQLLREKGAGPNSIVGLKMERSIQIIIGILAILKSGGAYLPIDPEYPEERIAYMLKDSNAGILVSELSEVRKVSEEVGVVPGITQPTDLCYILYTSGSSGRPKGVMVEHRNVVRLVKNNNYLQFREGDRLLQTGAIEFDASTFEIWGPLLNGLSLYLVPQKEILAAEQIGEIILKYDIGIIWLTSPLFNRFSGIDIEIFKGLKNLLVGGDVLSPVHIESVRSRFPGLNIINGYGPTENTTFSSTFLITQAYQERIPIGKPLANSTAYIVDKAGALTPIGVPGELWLGGDGVSRGYLNNPELTYRSYRTYSSKRIYKTGDLARWLPDGNIEFLGRIDHQVKIRGFRIELEEIENRLKKHNEIGEAIVLAKENREGDRYLCAYITTGAQCPLSGIRQYLAQQLPGYMIPSYFVKLDKIPLTPNGKIDRKLLPEPEIKTAAEDAAPGNEIEKKLAKIWSGVLGIDEKKISIFANFFEWGGHSLKAIILVSRIHKEFNVKIRLENIFEAPTIKQLAEYLKDAAKGKFSAVKPVEAKEYYPLSSAQKRMYILQHMYPESTSYNTFTSIILEGHIDREKLEGIFVKLIKRHESFRTSFQAVNGEPVQEIQKELKFGLNYLEAPEDDAISIISGFEKPFDLAQAPLLRAGLVKIGPEKYILTLDQHHIITDGTSYGIFIKEFMMLYQGVKLPVLRIQYKDFSEWQNDLIRRGVLKKQEKYWFKQFEGEIPLLKLPVDYDNPSIDSLDGDSAFFEIDKELTAGINGLVTETRSTLHIVLLAAYNILLSKYSGQDDIIVGCGILGRTHADLENIIGMFVNLLPMRNYPGENKTAAEFLQEVKENSLHAYENQDYQFDELVVKLGLNRNRGRNPIFNTEFTFLNTEIPEVNIPGLNLKPHEYKKSEVQFDLSLNAGEVNGTITLSFQYLTGLFERSTIEDIAGNYVKILEYLVENKNIKLSEINISHGLRKGKSGIPRDNFIGFGF